MIQLIEGAPEGVLAFEAVGEVDAQDYEDVLMPAVEDALAGGDRLRFVFEIGCEFDRYSDEADWDEMMLGFDRVTGWQRCALVTDLDWVGDAARALGWLMGGRLKVFHIDDLRGALEWAAADD